MPISQTEYLKRLESVPNDRIGFIMYINRHNKVVYRGEHFIGVENIKYHDVGSIHYTFFSLTPEFNNLGFTREFMRLLERYKDYSAYINQPNDRSLMRWHFHICQKSIKFQTVTN